ncbi:hypothetical protein SLI_8007 [Streptomyces lividans 1326]|uniref:Uncharacterized protein n=1 Tax=Streptomyces lividans 1326 TaxID=1200984 RepID=A0A7U9HFI8_STRLI|nr:hypothetical protein SLI_8007 [Streptomyces lividans 1326]
MRVMTVPPAASCLVVALRPAGKVPELPLTVASDHPGRTGDTAASPEAAEG